MEQVVSQTFVHKYGFETTEKDWEERERDGKVVSILKNGVQITKSYENGLLHGPTTYTFPHSKTVEKIQMYDQGSLLKEKIHDAAGMPVREEVYEFDDRKILTQWDEKGVPLSIEEYHQDRLMEAKYYTPDHELEASIVHGYGERVKRDRLGALISRDTIENGAMIARTTYHPNGHPHTISHYDNYELHGLQTKFTASGNPLMELEWNHGVLDGNKIVYRNGSKVAVIPYVNGKKEGIEVHYDDLGTLTAEIKWKNDKKHGSSKLFSEEMTETDWFFKGQSVSAEKYEMLESREQMLAEFRE